MDLYRAGEDYLKAIYILQKANGTVRSMDVVNRLRVSRASVSRAVRLLREGGFLSMDEDKALFLTEAGHAIAERIYERYCVLNSWLIRMGIDPETAERDACRMEHDISEKSVTILRAQLEKA